MCVSHRTVDHLPGQIDRARLLVLFSEELESPMTVCTATTP
eukprot:COSAG01_NODE_56345_length_319_cov_0.650000_1_plen_40_part_01